MQHLLSFSFALRPFSLGLTGLCVLVGEMDSGDRETVVLCGHADGRQVSERREVSQVVDLDQVIDAAEQQAQALGPNPDLPMAWIRTQDSSAWHSELGVLQPAMLEVLKSVKSQGVRNVLARVKPTVVTAAPVSSVQASSAEHITA